MTSLLVSTESRSKAASVLVVVELRSAIRRRQLLGDVSKTEGDLAVLSFQIELDRVHLLPLTHSVLEIAGEMIERQRLRTLDAIQLATAILAARELGESDELVFVVSDKRLLLAAELEGLAVWNPETP